MGIKFWIVIGVFYLIRFFINKAKKQKEAENKAPKQYQAEPIPKSKTKNLDDIFGDFMKEINKTNQPKPVAKPIIQNDDYHKAQEDTHKKLDWQEVTTSRFQDNEQSQKYADYKNISHKEIEEQPIVETKVEETPLIQELGRIDLKKAVLYKEILERKYFSI